ncbi:MAG TPA: VWA domain-containing protein [Terracidiphilus sp.]|nr:VWA domain-containing protein [Terracidiphilus sp.]
MDAIQTGRLDFNLFLIGTRDPHTTEVQRPNNSISTLDLKAPRKARHEYEQGYKLLMRNDLQGAVQHLTGAIAAYPSFVAAHNSLGSAYLKLGQNEQAFSEFTRAVALDDHLPNSYLNLGCAELALNQFPAAEASLRKASSIAPLDTQLKLALAYGEFANHDYNGVIATAREVHEHKHDGAAVVHLFAAGAFEAQGNFSEAQREMETLLEEDPQSPSAGQFHHILDQIRVEQTRRAEAKLHPVGAPMQVVKAPAGPSPEELARRRQYALQQQQEEKQIVEAEAAPDPTCADCSANRPDAPDPTPDSSSDLNSPDKGLSGPILRINVNEASVFFAATDHGKPVTDLLPSDVDLRDDGKPPETILGFRNESQLPLRLGLVIDTSDSVAQRFSFEQAAATRFLQETAFRQDDLAFVVGVNNVVLLAQDFTADQTLTSRAIYQLASSGGTSVWDAVAFAADKLADRPETQPVARILVVISDGEDNSSSTTLKQAIARAQRDEVAVYTVSTSDGSADATIGDRALSTLADLTGGASFMPGSIRFLKGSLSDLQQVIRSRYLISYKPASFKADSKYRTIDLAAQKDGHKLKIFARKGYYATAAQPASLDH